MPRPPGRIANRAAAKLAVKAAAGASSTHEYFVFFSSECHRFSYVLLIG